MCRHVRHTEPPMPFHPVWQCSSVLQLPILGPRLYLYILSLYSFQALFQKNNRHLSQHNNPWHHLLGLRLQCSHCQWSSWTPEQSLVQSVGTADTHIHSETLWQLTHTCIPYRWDELRTKLYTSPGGAAPGVFFIWAYFRLSQFVCSDCTRA